MYSYKLDRLLYVCSIIALWGNNIGGVHSVLDWFDNWPNSDNTTYVTNYINNNSHYNNDNQFGEKDHLLDNSWTQSSDHSLLFQAISSTYSTPFVLTSTITTTTTTPTTTTSTPSPTTPTPTSSPPPPPTQPSILPFTRKEPPLPPPFPTTQSVISTTSTPLISRTTPKQMSKCLNIALNTKVVFKYTATDGVEQQIELSAGMENGELYQPDKCQTSQDVFIKFEMIDKTLIILRLTISESHITFNKINFEFPLKRLPDDYQKPTNMDQMKTCSQTPGYGLDSNSDEMCLIAVSNELTEYSFKYRINEQIFCKQLPQIILNTHNKGDIIEVAINHFNAVYTNNETLISQNTGLCPLNDEGTTSAEPPTSLAGSTKIWVGIGFAITGAFIIFGVILFYEKVIKIRIFYTTVSTQESKA